MVNEAAAVGGGGRGGDESGLSSASSSPKNRVKFLCSHGGKIMPRPSDNHLKYVGGETRVIAVDRDINFSELMKKLSAEFEGDVVLKYQVIPEDLDVLVSVRNDQDLKHMLEEYDRHENEGAAKLRTFLFPTNPVVTDNQTCPMELHAAEQRYIDAINDTVRMASNSRPPSVKASHPIFSISSCSSPQETSPESNKGDFMYNEPFIMNGHSNSRPHMHKVRSSPSLSSLNSNYQSNKHSNHQFYQQHHPCGYQQQLYPYGYQPSVPLADPRRLGPVLSLGRPDFERTPIGPNVNKCYSCRHNVVNVNPNIYCYSDEHSHFGYKMVERSDGVPHSPRNKILE